MPQETPVYSPLTDEQLAAIEARCAEVPPFQFVCDAEANFYFCKHASADVPALLADVRALRTTLEVLLAHLQRSQHDLVVAECVAARPRAILDGADA